MNGGRWVADVLVPEMWTCASRVRPQTFVLPYLAELGWGGPQPQLAGDDANRPRPPPGWPRADPLNIAHALLSADAGTCLCYRCR